MINIKNVRYGEATCSNFPIALARELKHVDYREASVPLSYMCVHFCIKCFSQKINYLSINNNKNISTKLKKIINIILNTWKPLIPYRYTLQLNQSFDLNKYPDPRAETQGANNINQI